MAITIQQHPYSPAIANSDLIYVVTSNQISQAQFQYVCDVLDKDGNLLQRINQEPNPSGKGVFNLKNIISTQFTEPYSGSFNPSSSVATGDYFTLVAEQNGFGGMLNPGIVKDIQVRFGESYAASVTATPTLYNGNGSAGDPAVYSSEWISVLNGELDYNDRRTLWYDETRTPDYYQDWGIAHNLTSSINSPAAPINIFGDLLQQIPSLSYDYSLTAKNSIDDLTIAPKYFPIPNWGNFKDASYDYTTALYKANSALTDLPLSSSMGRYDYMNLSFLNGSLNGKNGVLGQWVYQVIVDAKDADGNLIVQWGAYNPIYKNANIIPVANNTYPAVNSATYSPSQSEETRVGVYPIGMKNYYDKGLTTSQKNDFNDIAYLDVIAYSWGQEVHNFPLNEYTGSGAGEEGESIAYIVPSAILDATRFAPTGSYPTSPFRFELLLGTGTTLQVHVTQSDAQLLNYPAATAESIAEAINTEWRASGEDFCTEIPLAYTYDWPNYEEGFEGIDKGLLVVYPGTTGTAGTVDFINSSSDAFGAPAFGNASVTGFSSGSIIPGGNYNPYQVKQVDGEFVGWYAKYHIDIIDSCDYETKRFAWKNRWGAHDWWTFTLAESIVDNITRDQYTKTNVDYSTTTNTFDKDLINKGKTQFTNKIDKQYRVESDWVDNEVADYLYGLFKSTDVYVQGEDGMNPVVITNTSVTEKTNPRTQKLYKFTVEYKMSNEERERK